MMKKKMLVKVRFGFYQLLQPWHDMLSRQFGIELKFFNCELEGFLSRQGCWNLPTSGGAMSKVGGKKEEFSAKTYILKEFW